MGAFSDLMVEALELGIEDVEFTVNLRCYAGVADHVPRWSARAGAVKIPHVATGRTGEEALRELVVFVRAFQGEKT